MENITMNGNFIKILDEETAQVLYKSGFSYIIEKQNQQDVYVFSISPELLQVLNLKFANTPVVMENKLRF